MQSLCIPPRWATNLRSIGHSELQLQAVGAVLESVTPSILKNQILVVSDKALRISRYFRP